MFEPAHQNARTICLALNTLQLASPVYPAFLHSLTSGFYSKLKVSIPGHPSLISSFCQIKKHFLKSFCSGCFPTAVTQPLKRSS